MPRRCVELVQRYVARPRHRPEHAARLGRRVVVDRRCVFSLLVVLALPLPRRAARRRRAGGCRSGSRSRRAPVAVACSAALDPTLDNDDCYAVANPIGVDGLHDVEPGRRRARAHRRSSSPRRWRRAASLVVRFRRSRGVERAADQVDRAGGVRSRSSARSSCSASLGRLGVRTSTGRYGLLAARRSRSRSGSRSCATGCSTSTS